MNIILLFYVIILILCLYICNGQSTGLSTKIERELKSKTNKDKTKSTNEDVVDEDEKHKKTNKRGAANFYDTLVTSSDLLPSGKDASSNSISSSSSSSSSIDQIPSDDEEAPYEHPTAKPTSSVETNDDATKVPSPYPTHGVLPIPTHSPTFPHPTSTQSPTFASDTSEPTQTPSTNNHITSEPTQVTTDEPTNIPSSTTTEEPTYSPIYEITPTQRPSPTYTRAPTYLPTSTPTLAPAVSSVAIAVGITVGAVLVFALSAFLIWNSWAPHVKPEVVSTSTSATGLSRDELQPLIGRV